MVGDTHHLKNPLRQMVEYARDACADFIVSICNRHHLRWFRAAGFDRVAWFLAVRNVPRPLRSARAPQLGFVGQSGGRHVRQARLIAMLMHAGVPLSTGTGSREVSADVYAQSVVSFNASLNGDLNFRVFEVLSAGGCLLTDRLSDELGLGLLFDEGTHYFGYDTPEELLDKARHLLRRPDHALAGARAGDAAFIQSMLPSRRAEDMLAWVFEDRLNELYRAPADTANDQTIDVMERLRVYEALQQLHLEKERPRVLFDAAVPQVYRSDAADLRRLETIVAPDGGGTGAWDAVISAEPEGIVSSVR